MKGTVAMDYNDSMDIRVRFAPSPTGYFHIGSVRTALFNWFFARQNKGKFIIRIEDTDRERSLTEYETDILDGLTWLGLDWDELYRQSERLSIYKEYLERLLEEGKAYYCFCSKEDLEAEKTCALADGLPAKYSGRCRSLPSEEVVKRVATGEAAVIRLKIPEQEVVFKDLIRGQIKFSTRGFGDLVIAKNLEEPLYNFAVVIDDALMNITHVIRGEDHLSNTPKQIVFAEILKLNIPEFAHLPLILNPDRTKMSKRFAHTALREYRAEGYLPEAIINFTAMLGWHSSNEKEIMSRADMLKEFDLKRVQKASAIFNLQKLDWLNGHYLKTENPENLKKMLKIFIPTKWANHPVFSAAVELEKDRLKTLKEFSLTARFFFETPDYDKELLLWKEAMPTATQGTLSAIQTALAKTKKWDKTHLAAILEKLSEEYGKGETYWPLRVALSGEKNSPPPVDLMAALGRDESLIRLQSAIKKLDV